MTDTFVTNAIKAHDIPTGVASAYRQTIQEFEDAKTKSGNMIVFSTRRGLIPEWGTVERDIQLRKYFYREGNDLIQGAIVGFIKRISATPFKITGPPRMAARFTEMFQEGDFGVGWRNMMMPFLLDYLTQDKGSFLEIIGAGKANTQLRGPVLGLAHLDAGRCALTGDPIYPVAYRSRITGEHHQLHHSRVLQFRDTPSSDENRFGMGFCALSRMIVTADVMIKITQYERQRLDDLPPAGVAVVSNITKDEVKDAREIYEAEREARAQNVWATVMYVYSLDPNAPAKIELVPFSQLPEHFNKRDSVEIAVNIIALALGVDPQEIWPLTGTGTFGTGTQSAILHGKGRMKSIADTFNTLERAFNIHVLPPSLRFAFDFRDEQQELQKGALAERWSLTVSRLASPVEFGRPIISVLEGRQLLARMMPDEFGVILRDEEEQDITLPDADVPELEELAEVSALPETVPSQARPAPNRNPVEGLTRGTTNPPEVGVKALIASEVKQTIQDKIEMVDPERQKRMQRMVRDLSKLLVKRDRMELTDVVLGP